MNVLHFFGNRTRRLWWVLGFGVLGLAAASTVLTFFLPLVLKEVTDSNLAIGFAVGVEGAAALTVPLVVGQASDHTWTRFGRRVPYMLAATPLIVSGLVSVALLHTYWAIVGAVIVFFIGYYTYYTAYQSLYPDTLESSEYGRAWASLNIFQGIGTAIALMGGGALLGAGIGTPFVFAALLFVLVMLVSVLMISEKPKRRRSDPSSLYKVLPNFLRRLRQDRNLSLFLASHFCWEFSLAAIRAFVILYLTIGLGLVGSQLVTVLAVVIIAYLVAAITSGNIIDRHDPRNYTAGVILAFGLIALTTGLTTDTGVLTLVTPLGVFAGAAVLMLSYPILLRVTPDERHGEYTGYYQFNRGLALLTGTAITGLLIDKLDHHFPETEGFQVLWLVVAAMILISLPFFLALTRRTRASTQR